MHVQQLFLTASWYKSESKFVESWHALGAAIREAQEIGLNKHLKEFAGDADTGRRSTGQQLCVSSTTIVS